jgi:hypothetical protein
LFLRCQKKKERYKISDALVKAPDQIIGKNKNGSGNF